MTPKQVNDIFNKLPSKRRKVLVGFLAGHSREKIMIDAGVPSDAALTGHLKELYKNFRIDTGWNDADDRRSGARKLPLLISLFARCKPELISDRIPDVLDGIEQEDAIAKLLPESGKAVDTSVNDFCSEQGVDYTRLWELLVANRWLEADRETLAIMLKVSGREKECWLRVEDIKKISSQVLHSIDQLWVAYSKKRFGFSVQQQLIQLIDEGADIATWLQFATHVGWRKNNNLWLTLLEIEVKRLSIGGDIAELFPVGFFPYQYSFGSKIHRGAIGDWREPSPVSAFLLLHRDF